MCAWTGICGRRGKFVKFVRFLVCTEGNVTMLRTTTLIGNYDIED